MSFSGDTKGELCREGLSRRCCAQAEAYGVLLFCNTFQPGEIRITTEEGYVYVCARLKSGDLHPAERSDLSKVRDYYRIVSEFDVLSDALIRGDNAKAGRILNRAVRA